MSAIGSLLFVNDAVRAGMGPAHCSADGRDGRVCGAFVGLPAPGSILVAIEPAAYLEHVQHGFYAYRCSRCGACHIFSVPHPTKEVA
jgi:hypothetical protein